MALITRIKSWIDRECLTHTDLNAEFSNITDNIIASDLTNKGMIERATDAEVVSGTDEERAVTPAGMLARTGTTARIGLVQLEDSHASVLTTKAPCSKNVKEAYDKAVGVIAEHSDITSSGANIEDAVTKKHAANADTSVGTQSADINMGTHKLTALSVPSAIGQSVRTTASITETALGDAVTKKHAANADTALGAQSENLDMNTHKIIGVVDPTANQEAATKKYVDDNTGSVSDAVYDVNWNGVIDVAPSKNAVYDKIESMGGATDKIIEGDTGVEVIDTGNGYIVFTEDGAEVGRFTGGNLNIDGSIQAFNASQGYKYKSDAQGVFQHLYKENVVAHFSGTNVDGIEFQMGGQTWGYLIDGVKSTGHVKPQLYLKNPPVGVNYWQAPILIDSTTTNGENRAIGIVLTDTSVAGTLQATALEIRVDTPSDRGGDSSGIYVHQAGGGNAVSLYKLGGGGTGFALEVAADGGSHSIFTKAENGTTLLGQIDGSSGTGIHIFPSTDTSLSRRAFKVSNANNSVEKLYATLDGDIYTGGDIGIGIGSPTDRLHIHDTDSAIKFTTPVTGSTDSDGLVLGYQDGTYNKAFVWNKENTDLEIATNNIVRMAIKAGGDIDMKGNKIINVADPTLPQDAATKAYGDANWSGGGGDVVGPATHSASYVPQWNATPNSKTLIEGFTITAAGKALIDDADAVAQRTTLGLGTAATRAAEDSMTDGGNLPDGHAIKTYGDANWSGSGSHFVTPGAGTLSAAAAAASDGDVLWLKEGVYTETVPIAITSKSLSIMGAGPEVSIIRCTGTHGIVVDTNSVSRRVTLKDFTIETTSTGTYTAVQLETTGASASKTFYVSNIDVMPYDDTTDYWDRGIYLIYGWNTVIDGCHFRGKTSDTSMTYGIQLGINSVDVNITNCHFHYMNYSIYAGPSQVEGLTIDTCLMLYVEFGVYCHFTVGEPWIGFFNSHVNSFQSGLHLDKVYQTKIIGNLFYKHSNSSKAYSGIHIGHGDNNNIDSNQIRGSGAGGIENGIVLIASIRNIISNNIISDQDSGIWLDSASSCSIVAANLTSNCTHGILDQGTGNSVTDNLDI